jgi:mono/diheme cytochrome c family protein
MGKGFVLGVVVTLAVLAGGAYLYCEQGLADLRADAGPGFLDEWLNSAMDNSVKRHAPEAESPVPASEANLLAGARLYVDKCASCHGSPVNPNSDLGKAFHPSAPQFFGDDPPDMPANQSFYIVKHGIRMTGMPAWGFVMTDSEIWQVVGVLGQIKNLPASVQQELRKPTAVSSAP